MTTVNPVQTTTYYLNGYGPTNFGSSTNIAAIRSGVYYYGVAAMTNAGKISSAAGYGVWLRQGGLLTNYGGGSISGGEIGVELGRRPFYALGGAVTNAAGATISGGNYGVRIDATVASPMVTNAGTITQTGGPSDRGNYYAAVFLRSNGSVTNEPGGSISGSTGVVMSGGTVTNMAGATISGRIRESYTTSAPLTVTNSGKISGGVGGAVTNATTLTNESGGSIYGSVRAGTVVNYGSINDEVFAGNVVNARGATISGRTSGEYQGAYAGHGVKVIAPGGTVTNAGTITGYSSVFFSGGGAHKLILETGSTLNGPAEGDFSGANALVLDGTGTANNTFENFDTLTVNPGASWTLGGAFMKINAQGHVVDPSSPFSEVTIGSGALVAFDGATTVDFDGATTIAGTVSGSATLELGGGSTTLDSGAELLVADWTVSGSGTSVTLDEDLTYAGAFTGGAGTTLDLSGGNLTLTGTDAFTGAATSGSQVLYAEGTTTVSGLTIGGTTTFDDTNQVMESGGSATVGDAAGDVARLQIASGAAWDILDDSGIGLGSSTASSIGNSGLLEKTGGTGTSTIAPNVANNGSVLVSSGALDLKGAVSGGTVSTPGTDTISGASTLEFDSTVGAANAVGSQDIRFTGGGGTLDLTDPQAFWGEISGFAATDAIDLQGSWKLSQFAEVSDVAELTLESGTATQTFDFVGDFNQSSFNIVSGATTVITLVSSVTVAAFLSEQATLDAIPGGFAILDSAANVAANIDALNADPHINSIALTDPTTPTLTITAAQLTSDATALGDIVSPYNLTVTGVAAANAAAVAATTHVTSVAVSDTGSDVAANLDALQILAAAGELTSITLTDATTPTLTLTIEEALNDGTALGKITSPHTLTVAGTAASVLALTVAQASAFESEGYALAVQDTAADIDALTAAQITSLAARHVQSVASVDTSLALSEADAVDLETGGITISVPTGSTAVVSDLAGNIQKLTAAQITGLAAIGFAGITSTNASVTLTVAQALALEGLGLTIAVPSGDTRRVSDMASAVDGLSATEIAGLAAIGVTSVAATGTGATLSVQQAVAFETANLALTAPSGASNTISDTASEVEGLTAAEISGLGKLHIAKIAADAGLTLSAAQAGAVVSGHIALSLPVGDSVVIVDTASHIEALTATQFAALAGLGVKSITATDTGLALTEAEAVDLETAGIPVSVPADSTAIVSDTAANLEKLTAAQITGLAAIGFAGMASTNASMTLNATQALALKALGWTDEVPGGDTVKVSDTASAIEALSATQIGSLSGIGVTSVAATVSGVALTAQQADAFETANLTLTAPSGMSNTISDTASDIKGLTAAEISGLSKLHVTSIGATDTSVALTAAQAGALLSAKIALSVPTGDSVSIVDTAADIEGLTATRFAALAGLGVKSITATDTGLALTEAEAVDLETAGIPVSVPADSTAIVSDTAANLEKLTAAQISGLAAIGVTELFSNNANVTYSAAQTSAILASGLTVAAAGSDMVTENFANGDYSVFQNGSLITQKSVNADASYDLAHFDVSGLGYSSYEDIYSVSGAHVAEARDMIGGSGTLSLYGDSLTVNSGPSQLSVTTGADTFTLNPHSTEAVTASGLTGEVFEYEAGFGQSTITGFAATGGAHDILQFPSAVFADATALLNNAVQVGANVEITDAASGLSDALILHNVAKTNLAANPNDFKFA
jgi:hypothetical protein